MPVQSLVARQPLEHHVKEQWPKLRKFLFKVDTSDTWNRWRTNGRMPPGIVKTIVEASLDLQEAAFQIRDNRPETLAHPKLETLYLSLPSYDRAGSHMTLHLPSLRQLHLERTAIRFLNAESSANIRECTIHGEMNLDMLKAMPA